MKYSKKGLLGALLLAAAHNAAATIESCSVGDVHINTIQVLDGSPVEVLAEPLSATACLGAFEGNNSVFSNPDENLGYKDDGWFNIYGYWPDASPVQLWSTPGVFVEESELQNLQGLGDIDPGWIYVGKGEGDNIDFEGATMNEGGDPTYTFIDDLLTLNNCLDKDGIATSCGQNAVQGEFSWNPPAMNPPELMELLGGQFFDRVGIVFKSSKRFAIYEFDLAELGLDPVFEDDFNYAFTGTWDMSSTLINPGGNPAGLSNISVWARDPADIPEVSAPATGLLSSLALLFLLRRRQR